MHWGVGQGCQSGGPVEQLGAMSIPVKPQPGTSVYFTHLGRDVALDVGVLGSDDLELGRENTKLCTELV